MSSRSSSPRLPTFGIRDLSGPSNPPDLISISRRQYDNTIQAQPDAKLLYLDDDDGELITVGSSLELTQRLQDPVLKYSRGNFSETYNPLDGKLVHVFDIKHSSGSVARWKVHEFYTSESRRGTLDQANEHSSPIHATALAPLDSPIYSIPQCLATSPLSPEPISPISTPVQRREAVVSEESVKILDGLGQHLTGLASVLQIAANTFQKAAEKTHDTDTSVVEDILKGVKNILTEVGSFGAAAFDELNRGIDGPSSNNGVAPTEDKLPVFINDTQTKSRPESTSELQSEAETEARGCDLTEQVESSCNSTIFEPEALVADSDEVDHYLQAVSAVSGDELEETPKRSSPITSNPFRTFIIEDDCTSELESVKKVSFQTERPSSRLNNPSILDDSSDDADFTARYPPLRSIRRAQSTIESSKTTRPYIPYRPTAEAKSGAERVVDFSKPFYPRFTPACPVSQIIPSQVKEEQKPEGNETIQKPVPGAWPDAKNESTPALPISTESSGAFFNRMVGRNQLNEPPSFGLHRANTTASSNPASRLNRPFDPGFPYDPSTTSTWRPFHSSRLHRRSASPPRSLNDQVPTRASQPERFRDLPKLDTKRSVPDFARSARPRPANYGWTPSSSNDSNSNTHPVEHSRFEPHRAVKHHRSVPHFQPYAPPPPSSFQTPWPAPLHCSPPRGNLLSAQFVPNADINRRALRGFAAVAPSVRSPPAIPQPISSTIPILTAPYAPLLKPSDPPAPSSGSTDNTVRQSPIFPISLTPRNEMRWSNEVPRFGSVSTAPAWIPPVFPPPPPSAGLTPRQNTDNAPKPPSEATTSSGWRFEPAPITEEYSDALSSTSIDEDNSSNKYDLCVEKLKMCGFGIDDENLKDRLHVYAVAADGDVEEAVEMIEEDRRCNAGITRGRN